MRSVVAAADLQHTSSLQKLQALFQKSGHALSQIPKENRIVQKALSASPFVALRQLPLSITAGVFLFAITAVLPLAAQDDITTRNATSGLNGLYITGSASNPLSFLNGPAFRTTGSKAPYDFHDFAPATYLDQKLPKWIDL